MAKHVIQATEADIILLRAAVDAKLKELESLRKDTPTYIDDLLSMYDEMRARLFGPMTT